MSQRGISFRLNIYATALAIVIIASIVYVNYDFSTKVLIKKSEENAINQSSLVISGILRFTISTEEIAKNVSFQALQYYHENKLNRFLEQVLATNPHIENIHVELYDSKEPSYDANRTHQSCQHWNDNFTETNGNLENEIWSNPYFCTNGETQMMIACRVPIYREMTKDVIGMVYCEISFLKLKSVLLERKIVNNGMIYIINQDGTYLTHPNNEWVLSKNFFDKLSVGKQDNQDKLKEDIRLGQSGSCYMVSENMGKQSTWIYYAPLSQTNWRVVIAIPESELHKEQNAIFNKVLLACLLGIIIFFFANMFVFKKILSPLTTVAEAIRRFSSLPGEEQKSKNEIEMLTNSLESWQAKYGTMIKERKQTETEKVKIERDLISAREILQNIIPVGRAVFIEHPELDLFAIIKPVEKVGGDLYDYFFIDKDHLLVAIGDVSGKGIPASLFMAVASTLIKTNTKVLSANDIVDKVNVELSARNANQYFLTLFLAILDVGTGEMEYCNAAHNYPYILRADGSLLTLSESHGLPLGIYKDKSYGRSTVKLGMGDTIVLYTDGVINAVDSKNQHYGTERLENNIQNLSNLTSEEVVDRLLKSVLIYEGNSHQSDDITILSLRYLKRPAESLDIAEA